MSKVDFDDILTLLGSGKWNLIYFIGVSSCTFWLPSIIIAGTFVAPNVDFLCVPEETFENISSIDQCSFTTVDAAGNVTEHKCTHWSYNQSDSSNSLTTEFNLVCDRAYLRPTYQTAYMIGNIVGSPINGFLSDKFGRRTIVIVTTLVGVCSLLTSFLFHQVIWIIIARFLTGLCFHSMLLSSYTLFMEVCEPKYRSIAGILYTLPWAFGTIWWGCLGYLIRDWRWIQSASILPSLIIIICLCFYDESPRWLIVNGQHDKALEGIKKAARMNGSTSLPPDEQLRQDMIAIEKTALSYNTSSNSNESQNGNSAISHLKRLLNILIVLFKTRKLRKITLLMYFTFFVSGLVYYGLSLNADNFNLNSYFYIGLIGVVQIPVYGLTGHVIAKLGRIKPTVFTFFGCGVTSLVLAFLPSYYHWTVILFAIFGNFCIATAFQIIFLLGTEVFPTEVRLQGFGTSSFLSSVGGGVASYITDLLAMYYSWIPAVFFGILGIAAGIAAIFIPETLNKHLPETIDELEKNQRTNAE